MCGSFRLGPMPWDLIMVVFVSTGSHALEDDRFGLISTGSHALEDDKFGFDHHTQDFPNWINVLGLNKWENEIARDYDIHSTPSYFVLDKDKKIIAKPEDLVDVQELFKIEKEDE